MSSLALFSLGISCLYLVWLELQAGLYACPGSENGRGDPDECVARALTTEPSP